MDALGALAVGIGAGGLYAVIGVLLTLMSTLTRVINFSQVAVGVFAAYLALRVVPSGPAWSWLLVIATVLLAALFSAALAWLIVSRLGTANTTARSAITVATLLGLLSLSTLLFGTRPQALPPLLVGPAFTFGNVAIPKVGLAMLVLAVVLAVAAHLLLTKTPVGVQLRAISDRQTTAELLGVNVKLLQLGVWAATGAVMGLAVVIIGNTQVATSSSMIVLVIPGAAAALVGAFKHLGLTILGGLLVGGLQGVLTVFPSIVLLVDWIPIVVIVLFLLWTQRKEVWDVAR